jgi:hypothetical protein
MHMVQQSMHLACQCMVMVCQCIPMVRKCMQILEPEADDDVEDKHHGGDAGNERLHGRMQSELRM